MDFARSGKPDQVTIAAFRVRRRDEARSRFEALARNDADAKFARLYLERIAHWRTNPPPPDRDGIATYTNP